MPSPCYSSRGGEGVRLIVLHTAEGSTSIESLGAYFANPATEASSHVGIDDKPNTVGEYVYRSQKAWTAANANPVAVQAELCAFAAWDLATWQAHPNMLANTAAWIAEEAAAFDIPLVKLDANAAQGGARGVCQHNDLGAWGGGHWDCGPAFPIDDVLAMAAGGPAPGPTPPGPAPGPPTRNEDNMILTDPTSGGLWVVVDDPLPAAVWTYDGAPYLGATNSARFNADAYPCVGIANYRDRSGDGYTLVLDWGDSGKGDGKSEDGTGDRYRRYHFPRDGSGR